jgi:hypothetical protein
MKLGRRRCGFTVLELLVAAAITVVLAGMMLSVTSVTLRLWRTNQDAFLADAESKLVLDQIERDLHAAMFRNDAQPWFAVDVINAAGSLTTHGWVSGSPMKPASSESQAVLPPGEDGRDPKISDARFGLSGAWLRFVTTPIDAAGSLPATVSYQLVRRPVSGSVTNASNPAEIRYALFRSVAATDTTFSTGYNVLAGYGSTSASAPATRSARSITNPNNADVVATNVVDFGVWLYRRDNSGSLIRVFPASNSSYSYTGLGAADFPRVVDVFVRILTEQGARQIEAIERGGGALNRPAEFSSDAEWWWSVVEANSRVVVRRIEIRGGAL